MLLTTKQEFQEEVENIKRNTYLGRMSELAEKELSQYVKAVEVVSVESPDGKEEIGKMYTIGSSRVVGYSEVYEDENTLFAVAAMHFVKIDKKSLIASSVNNAKKKKKSFWDWKRKRVDTAKY